MDVIELKKGEEQAGVRRALRIIRTIGLPTLEPTMKRDSHLLFSSICHCVRTFSSRRQSLIS